MSTGPAPPFLAGLFFDVAGLVLPVAVRTREEVEEELVSMEELVSSLTFLRANCLTYMGLHVVNSSVIAGCLLIAHRWVEVGGEGVVKSSATSHKLHKFSIYSAFLVESPVHYANQCMLVASF